MADSAYLLLSLPQARISTPSATYEGALFLECVPGPSTLFLVLRCGAYEAPVDPQRPVDSRTTSAGRSYTLYAPDGSRATVDVDERGGDVEEFDEILGQYTQLHGTRPAPPRTASPPPPFDHSEARGLGYSDGTGKLDKKSQPVDDDDMRDRLVMINEDTNEIVGALPRSELKIRADTSLGAPDAPVIIDLPEEGQTQQGALEAFVRAVPEGQQDWLTTSATVVSKGITAGAFLLATTLTTAGNYYVSKTTPGANSTTPTSTSTPPLPPRSGSSSAAPNGTSDSKQPQQSRALMLLTSPRTRAGLNYIHTTSGTAYKLSRKTMDMIDEMVKHAMGNKGKPPAEVARPASTLAPPGSKPPLPPRTPSPSPSTPAPPYAEKPPLPSRSPSDLKPPLPPRSASSSPQPGSSSSTQPLGTRARLALSAELILATLDEGTKRVVDAGGSAIGGAVGHKYGKDAAENIGMMGGTAKNCALVYIDVRGIGRRALLRRAGKEFVKGRMK